MTVVELRNRLEALLNREVIYGIFFESVKAFEEYLIDFNKIRLEEGENVFGNEIGRYSRATELEYLFGEGPKPILPKIEGEPYNFQWTGGVFDGMKIEIFGDLAEFTSSDSKAPELEQKYGKIFGIQPQDYQEALKEKLFPDFINRFRIRLGYEPVRIQ